MATSDSTSRASRGSRLPLNEIRRVDGGEREAPDRSLPDLVSKHYHQDGNAFRSAHHPDKIEFVDRGNRMHAYRPVSTFTARVLASTAQLRGWSEVEITGTKEFKGPMYVELQSRGIGTRGYEPTDKDRDILKNRADRAAAKESPIVKAFHEASTKKAQTAAAKEFPQLKDAFVLKAALEKAAEQIPDPKGRENFHGGMMARIDLALYRGEALPEIRVREAPAKQAEAASQGR